MTAKLRIGYVPEHFSTPIHLAHMHFSLSSLATLHPVPSGTGHMIEQLRSNDLDLCIGLTEGFVAGLAKQKASPFAGGPVKIIGTYVQSPLCWAVSTGAQRGDVTDMASLRGTRVGVSRIGSGSHIMSSVLAQQQNWLPPITSTTSDAKQTHKTLTITPIGPFAALRAAVSGSSASEAAADFFMWEHFTTKKFWESGELKRVGEIYTPWPSWVVAARMGALSSGESGGDDEDDGGHRKLLRTVFEALDKGIEYFLQHREEALGFITENMEYSREDAEAWLQGVRFAEGVAGVDVDMIKGVVDVLEQVGVLGEGVEVEDVVGAV